MTLRDVLDAAAAEAGATAQVGADGGRVWAAGGQLFAALDQTGTTASFRLDRELAAAARRTPDVSASSRGPEWVDFRPSAPDDHAADRAAAWFAAAFRRAV